MSGRFQTHTVASEGVEFDDNYQKMVADIEEQTQRSGWLFGRGAFDKADLQYLRDFNNSLRYKEVEIEDKEKELWERERARVEAEAAAAANAQLTVALKRHNSGGSGGGAASASAGSGSKGPGGMAARPTPLLLPVKVKPASSRQQTTPQGGTSPAGTRDPAAGYHKRQRTDGTLLPPGPSRQPSPLPPAAKATGAKAAVAVATGSLTVASSVPAVTDSGVEAVGGGRASGAEGSTAGVLQGSASGGSAGVEDPQPQGILLGRSESAPVGTGAAAAAAGPGSKAAGGGGGGGGGAGPRDRTEFASGDLANLLGGYGSDEEEEEEEEEEGAGKGQRGGGGGGGGGEGGTGGAGGGVGRGVVPAPQQPGPCSGVKLPPPVGLLSPEELLGDPRVIAEGLLATRPVPQEVQGADAWDSGEASGSD